VVLAGATITIQTSAADNRNDWPTTAGDGNGTYHSPLNDINTTTVSRLGFAWDVRTAYPPRPGSHAGLEVNGVLYGVGNFGRLYAVDGATGKELWTYDPAADGQYGRYACCDVVNRGVAIKNGILYLESLDGYLHAIDAGSGRLLWKVDTFPGRGARLPYTSTGVPVDCRGSGAHRFGGRGLQGHARLRGCL
jgi:quinohemoprotein ethanol dehydrogenase